jgi:protoporphyrinogen oxidase
LDGSRDSESVIVIGAGPAGLSAAYELVRAGRFVRILEQDPVYVGGISRTVQWRGFRFDIGGHRFFSKNPEIERLWTEILGSRMRTRERLSRIYYRGQFFRYPLEPLDALRKLGVGEATACILSYLWAQAFGPRRIRSFEDWVVAGFGRRLYEVFFKTYTEKVWGIPCSEISADWAAQRIRGLSIPALLRSAVLPGANGQRAVVKTLIDRFRYPPLGPGEMWEEVARRVQAHGGELRRGERVVGLRCAGGRVVEVRTATPQGEHRYVAGHVISTMPIRELVDAIDPPAPAAVLEAARALRYRDFLTVVLVVDAPDLFADNWVYVHDPGVRVGRIQNFKNWSPEMVPDPRYTVLGLEYFCNEDDALWRMPDAELIDLGTRELAQIGLLSAPVVDGTVVRQPKAYPVYDHGYERNVSVVRAYLASAAANLQLAGRNGMHKYDNQDHAMLTGILAARNVLGATFDPWKVNSDAEYLEEVRAEGERGVPRRLEGEPSVWGIPALDVIRPSSGYLGTPGPALLADLAAFFVLHHYLDLWFAIAFAVGSLVGAAVHHVAEDSEGHRGFHGWVDLWNRFLLVATDAANCFLVNLGPMLLFVQAFSGRGTLARIAAAGTMTLLAVLRRNLLAARYRRLVRAAEDGLAQ